MSNIKQQYDSKLNPQAGVDEAGRGCLAGPVFAAAVILPKSLPKELYSELNDSKKISPKKRGRLKLLIEECAVAYSVNMVDNITIDKINILNSSIQAMHLSIEKLSVKPSILLIDGPYFKQFKDIPHVCIVKGDSKYMPIAAASILAKTHRDEYMKKIHNEYPEYCWSNNKGYASAKHCQAIELHGHTPYHRKSFHLKRQLRMDF